MNETAAASATRAAAECETPHGDLYSGTPMEAAHDSSDGGRGAAWAGTLFFSPTRAVYVGAVRDTDLHRHHAIQICIGLGRPFLLREGPQQPWRCYETVVVGSDASHQIDGRADRHVLVYLDPETPSGRHLVPPTGAGIAPLAETAAAALSSNAILGAAADDASVYAAVSQCLALTPLEQQRLDPRVARALYLVRADPQRFIAVASLAQAVGLSPRRLRDLFARDTGTGCRRLLLWLRLNAAVRSLAHQNSLTVAAHAAGFADSAHLSRTFRSMFGIAPSVFSRGVRFVGVDVDG